MQLASVTVGATAHTQPPCYRAPRLPPGSTALTIDGNLDKDEWTVAPWSAPFADIRGPDGPADEQPPPECETRMKMMWDDEYLYVGAIMKSTFETRSTFTKRLLPPGCSWNGIRA